MYKLPIVLLLLATTLLPAQNIFPWEVGGGINFAAYQGDLHTDNINFSFLNTKPGFSGHLRKNISNNFAARLNLYVGQLEGDDKSFTTPAWRQVRGVSFASPLIEATVLAEVYPLGFFKKTKTKSDDGSMIKKLSNNRRLITPFIMVGIGGAFSNPKVDWNDANGNDEINPALSQLDKDAKIKRINFVVPMGGGLRFALGEQWTINLEGALRPTFSDYLDGFSKAGISENNDWFFTVGAGVSYAFGDSKARRNNSSPREKMESGTPIADRDNDGVNDDKDDCPDMPGTRSLKGCPDADKDGVADTVDSCPDEAGTVALNGCPDRDKDGIADANDECPDSPGVAATKGCPLADRDKDGIGDDQDQCPDMAGISRWKGCPDTDEDGLPDNKDDCPGIAGPASLKGCPDTDNDGITDREDECPTIAGVATKKGCPDAMPAAAGVPYKAVYFNSTLQDWQSASYTTMDEAIEILKKDPSLKVRIEGHTDNTGEEPANDLLSERRAKKCRDYLISKGIPARRMNFVGFGSDRPVSSNETLEGRQQNRRVEIHFVK